uniref:AB hydrolase-1 domain-containing protein n=1 Tax=Calcidiscus leptoporus TaxID=127549 RepID=A0A7S0ING8_9EUKA|mmetsp:Transcript_14365/g.32789  ORF Transcript_14365/g.32789 Transcript_14365/m.32789 type:complete len:271 (+) Transcript_14365:164-976(+)
MLHVTTGDGVTLRYLRKGSEGPPVVLIHGWSASHRSFDLNIESLARRCTIFAPDLRFHGDSDKPAWGFHVARLAADLHALLSAWQLEAPTLVGCSLGCAVIWSYVELFGCDALGKCVFVDQAPSQWRFADWQLGSKGIYDAASLDAIQAALRADMAAFADGNARCCLTKRVPEALLQTLSAESQKCDPDALGKLMADHAPKDWRPILPRIRCACLNLYGTASGCFPAEGCAAVGTLIPTCRNVAFEGCNHWLYMEEPERFNQLVGDFACE